MRRIFRTTIDDLMEIPHEAWVRPAMFVFSGFIILLYILYGEGKGFWEFIYSL